MKLSSVVLVTFGVLLNFVSALSPVILIPGDGGSQVEARLNKTSVVHYLCAKTSPDYFNIWLNLELLVPFVIDCWIDNLRLAYDNKTRTTTSPPGVDIRIPGWGDPEVVEWLDPSHQKVGSYFHDISEMLCSMGYVRNVSIRGAPYDFRKAPNENEEFFVKLKSLIEETYSANNASAVTLLVHSMGGSMARHFLLRQAAGWKRQYVRRLVSLSTPWAGSVKALKVFAIGDDLGALVLRGSVMRAQQVTCPSLAYLLPAPALWPREVLVQTDKYNYTINDLEKFFKDLELPAAWEMWRDAARLRDDLAAPGVEVHCLYGTGLPTVERLVYPAGKWLDGAPTLRPGDGDGTVNLRSLQACETWRKTSGRTTRNAGYKVKSLPLPGAEHVQMLHDKRMLEYVRLVMTQP